MILTGTVIPEGEKFDCNKFYSQLVLHNNIVYITQRPQCPKDNTICTTCTNDNGGKHHERKIYKQAVLSSFVQYYFIDINNGNIYMLQHLVEDDNTQIDVWQLTHNLCLTDDDGRHLFTIINSKIVLKQKLVTQVVTRLTTTDLNSSSFTLLLLDDFNLIKLTDQTQITIQPDPNNNMNAIIDNTSFGLTSSVAYKFYPTNNPTYNCIEVTNLLEKTTVTLPYTSVGNIRFSSAIIDLNTTRGLITSISGVSESVGGSGYWSINPFLYMVAMTGNYTVNFNITNLRLTGSSKVVFAYVRVNGVNRDFARVSTNDSTINYNSTITINDIAANSVLQFGLYQSYSTATGTFYRIPSGFDSFNVTVTRL